MNTQLQHLLALLVTAVLSTFLSWAHTDLLSWATAFNPYLAVLVGWGITYLAAWAAPFMTAFGPNRKVVASDGSQL